MQQSPSPWPRYSSNHSNYYNPISQIRTLIKNLDAELMQLCHRTITPLSTAKTKIPRNSRSNSYTSAVTSPPNRISPSSMISTTTDPNSGVHVRTLSSIYRAKVIDAYRNRRIFTVYGNYHTVRRALLRRGWLEKLPPGRYPKLNLLSEETLLQHAKRGNDYEAVAISKIINHFPAFFIWQPKAQRDLNCDVLPHRNRVRRSRNMDFSTKVGLIGCAEQEQWHQQDGVCEMSYPRFYRLGGNFEERMSFVEDFRRTQCRNLIRYVAEHLEDESGLCNELEGGIQTAILKFAIAQLKRQLGDWEHSNLDDDTRPNTDSETIEWQNFMMLSNKIIHGLDKFKASLKEVMELASTGVALLRKIEAKRPDYKWDGYRNLWILKPGYQSRGIGITIRGSLDDILQWCNNNAARRYIAQKYIERPLLVYKTKFDIRQYLLLSIGETRVSIWMYKDCYLRFSSQEFTIDDLRESIHLTNNSVQKRYKVNQARDPRLPRHNMWSLEQFKVYLRQVGAPEYTWDTIYTGLKENLISVVMASLEETEFTENSFELYGCDFMLDEDYRPILIEINSTPDLSPSTEVTARICPNALKDLVKVIVDLPRNNRAPTGLFELVYDINYRIKSDVDAHHPMECLGRRMTIYRSIKLPANRVKAGAGGYNHNNRLANKKENKAKDTAKQGSGNSSATSNKSNAKQAPTKVGKAKSEKIIIGRQKAILSKSKIQTVHDNPRGSNANRNVVIIHAKKLNSFAKEALAMRYTQPK